MEMLPQKTSSTDNQAQNSSSRTTDSSVLSIISLRKKKLTFKLSLLIQPTLLRIIKVYNSRKFPYRFEIRKFRKECEEPLKRINFVIEETTLKFIDNLIKDLCFRRNLNNSVKEKSLTINQASILTMINGRNVSEENISRQNLLEENSGFKKALDELNKEINFEWFDDNISEMESRSLRLIAECYNQANPDFKRINKDKVSQILKERLQMKFQAVPLRSNFLTTEDFKRELIIYTEQFVNLLQEGLTPIFIDESYFRRISGNKKSWRKNGNEEIEPIFCDLKRDTVTFTLAVSKDEVIYFETNRQTNKSKHFLSFLKSLKEKLDAKGMKKYFLMMDNASIHRSQEVKQFIREEKAKTILSVRYYCELNLAEYLFSNVKKKIYRKFHANQWLNK